MCRSKSKPEVEPSVCRLSSHNHNDDQLPMSSIMNAPGSTLLPRRISYVLRDLGLSACCNSHTRSEHHEKTKLHRLLCKLVDPIAWRAHAFPAQIAISIEDLAKSTSVWILTCFSADKLAPGTGKLIALLRHVASTTGASIYHWTSCPSHDSRHSTDRACSRSSSLVWSLSVSLEYGLH